MRASRRSSRPSQHGLQLQQWRKARLRASSPSGRSKDYNDFAIWNPNTLWDVWVCLKQLPCTVEQMQSDVTALRLKGRGLSVRIPPETIVTITNLRLFSQRRRRAPQDTGRVEPARDNILPPAQGQHSITGRRRWQCGCSGRRRGRCPPAGTCDTRQAGSDAGGVAGRPSQPGLHRAAHRATSEATQAGECDRGRCVYDRGRV